MSSSGNRKGKARKKEKRESRAGKVVEEVEGEVKKAEKAVVKEAKRVEKAVERKAEKKAVPQRPSGHVPTAMVTARHGLGTTTRAGRGFSLGELSGGGLPPGLAAKWGVRIDLRRRSVLDGNVSSLRAWNKKGAGAKIEREAKRVEGELEKVGKEVEEEAVEVEKEVVKGVAKAEKAVKRKVERPKARPKKRV